MKVIKSEATTTLFDMIESLTERPHESWQCVYLKPIHANDANGAHLSAINAKAIIEQLSDVKGTIYLCEDGDIVMLFQRSAKAIVGKLSNYLGDSATSVGKSQHTHNLFGVFDLGKHWQGFYSLCMNKYLKVVARTEERHMKMHAIPAIEPMVASAVSFPMAAAN